VNPGKSDSIYIGTSVQTSKISRAGAVMSETSIPLSGTVRSLGVLLDQRLSLEDHVKNVCRVCNYHIKGLRSLRTSLDSSTAETIGRSIVMSRLDYCNSLLIGTSRRNIHRLQMVQNNLARVVSGVNFRENVHQVLTALHWLPVEQRIKFKVNVLVFKSRINCLPDYLSKDLTLYSSVRPIRSGLQNTYVVPRVKNEIAKHSFSYAGPKQWNDLPDSIRSISSLPVFKKQLKTFLFCNNLGIN
jgi:hypothetical protein